MAVVPKIQRGDCDLNGHTNFRKPQEAWSELGLGESLKTAGCLVTEAILQSIVSEPSSLSPDHHGEIDYTLDILIVLSKMDYSQA